MELPTELWAIIIKYIECEYFPYKSLILVSRQLYKLINQLTNQIPNIILYVSWFINNYDADTHNGYLILDKFHKYLEFDIFNRVRKFIVVKRDTNYYDLKDDYTCVDFKYRDNCVLKLNKYDILSGKNALYNIDSNYFLRLPILKDQILDDNNKQKTNNIEMAYDTHYKEYLMRYH